MPPKKVLLVLFLAAAWNLSLPATELEDFKVQLQKIAEEPFAGTPAEYKAFSQKQGSALIDTADKMLTQPNLSPEDKRYALLMKYWGLVRKFGFDQNEVNQKLDEYAKSIEDIVEVSDLFKTIMENQYSHSLSQLWGIADPKAQVEAFIKHRDRFLPYVLKYCTTEDPRQLTNILAEIADQYDFDGSYGLILSTVDPMLPVLKELEKSDDFLTQACAKMTQGRAFRIRLTGKELEYKGVATTGELIDVADYRGKVVLLSAETPWQSWTNVLDAYKKLFASLHDQGFVMINQVDGLGDIDVDRQNAEDNGISWITTSRGGGAAKKLEDYQQKYGLQNTVFLLDREGKVLHSWSDGLCAAVLEKLQTLFPEQETVLSEIRAELVQNKEQSRAKRVKMFADDAETFSNAMGSMLKSVDDSLTPRGEPVFTDVLLPQIATQARGELTDVLLSMPEINPSLWRRTVRIKMEILRDQCAQKLKNHPKMKPEEAFKEWAQTLEELEQSPHAQTGVYNENVSLLFEMVRYIRQTDSEADFIKAIQKRWIETNKREIDRQKSLPPGQRHFGLLTHYNGMVTHMLISAMEEIDEDGSQGLVSALCDALAPILNDSGSNELKGVAAHLQGISRRSGSIGKEFEFECILMNGEKINVKDLRGKIVLVNFWATWCGPCIQEFPNMKTQYEKYKPKGYEMIALSTDAEVEKIVEFQVKNDYPWLVGSLVKSKDAGLVDYHAYYGIRGIPTTFLLDRTGKVLFHMVGSDDDVLNRELAKAFGE